MRVSSELEPPFELRQMRKSKYFCTEEGGDVQTFLWSNERDVTPPLRRQPAVNDGVKLQL